MPTDEDVIRDLLHRSTAHLRPPESVAIEVAARQHRLDRRRRVASLAATGAALGTAAGVIALVPRHAPATSITPPVNASPATGTSPATSTLPAITLTANQRALVKLSSLAAGQPASHDRYVELMTGGTDVKDTSVIDSLTGDMWSYQQGTNGSPSGTGPVSKHYSPTAAQFAAMPTDPTALRAALIAEWNAQNEAAADAPDPQRSALAARGIKPIPVVISDDDKAFQQATYLLWNPVVGPALRSALYQVLVNVPGVVVNSSAHDADGRPAVEISRTDTTGLPGGKSDGDTYATYESPATGELLETAIHYPPGTGPVSPADMSGPTLTVTFTVYLSITRSSTVPPNPYNG